MRVGSRFNRTYELTINPNTGQPPINLFADDLASTLSLNQYQSQSLIISHPYVRGGVMTNGLGIKFRVERGLGYTNNTANIEIFNLNTTARRFLTQDLYNLPLKDRIVNLFAGYLGQNRQKKIFNQLFTGHLMEGGSVRVETDIITKLCCQEGGYFLNAPSALVNQAFGMGVTGNDILRTLLQAIGLNINALICSPETKKELANVQQPQTLIGNAYSLLTKQYGQTFFVDNGTPTLLKFGEVITGIVPILTSSTGLIGTPLRQETKIIVKTMFEPRIILGQILEIQSDSTPEYNGQYKVVGIFHEGTISPSQNAELITTIQLFIGTQSLGAFKLIA